ncbi:MAG TPA: ATP-binding protein [Gammaproteobacteria bacterium]|nr:ATP-binding protein [Gammaproteobacteria bacterium]
MINRGEPPSMFRADHCLAGGGRMGALMRSMDWSRTPLGPVSGWPQSLRTSVSICLGTSFPMMIAWGSDLLMLYNDGYLPVLGSKKHPAALGAPLLACFAEIRDLIGPMFRGVLETGEPVGAEDMMFPIERHGFPEETYFVFSYSPIRDESGRVGGVLTTCTETTQRVIGQRRLRTLRILAEIGADAASVDDALARAARAFDPADMLFALLYLLEVTGDRVRLSAAAGLEPGGPASPVFVELAGGRESVWPFDRCAAQPQLAPLDPSLCRFPGGAWAEPATQALVLSIRAHGDPRPYGFLVAGLSPRLPLDDAYRGYLDLVADHVGTLIAKARAREEEQRRLAALAELDHAKTIFFTNVSHEFRTPLTLMLGPLEDLVSGEYGALEGPHKEQVEIVQRNALRLLKLVNGLLDFVRIEAGRAQALLEPLDLAELTRDLASLFRAAVDRAGLELRVDCPPLPTLVHADRDMWEKIVLNLLSNALKFTFEGSISVTLRERGGVVELEVSDTGVGIPADELPKLFNRFHRVLGTRRRSHEGSGIGLALVQELVRLHGGSISCESELGAGTSFRVKVPVGLTTAAGEIEPQKPAAEAQPHAPAGERRAQRPSVPAGISAKAFLEEALGWLPDGPAVPRGDEQAVGPAHEVREPARILVADDNADMRAFVRRLLSPYWSVETVGDGAAALDAALRRPPDLVITDVMMPGLDGFALLRALKSDERTRAVPVVMLSARAGEEARVEGLEAGVEDYVVKPFNARELVARVRSQLMRSAARRAVELHRSALYDLFMQAPAPICVFKGPDLVFEMANPLYRKLAGTRDLVGKRLLEALPELTGQGLDVLLSEVMRKGREHVGRDTLVRYSPRADGKIEDAYFTFVYAPLCDADGLCDRVMAFCHDVTEQVRSRGELEEARRRSDEAVRAKDEFIAMLSHELRNPLAPIKTALQLMKLRGADQLVTERTIIERQVAHLVTLVDDLLDVARVARGKIQLRRRRTDVAEVVEKAIEMASPLLEERRHGLTVHVAADLIVDGDELRLTQIVANLLTNAAKYTPPGGQIAISAGMEAGDVVVRVRDNGIGMSGALMPRVFDLFVQGKRPEAGQGGLGLGLSLVRSLVELHGGSVGAHSEGEGRGSEFLVRLPRAVEPSESSFAASAGGRTAAGGSARKVLVVDDNRDAAETLKDLLDGLGYEVRAAFDGPDALEIAAAFEPDLALVDLAMPVMDGFELARRLRELPCGERMKLIAVTGYGQEHDRVRSGASGFDLHLVKPLDFAALNESLEALLVQQRPGSPVSPRDIP